MIAACMPLHGIMITFQQNNEKNHQYLIAQSYLRFIKPGSRIIGISETKQHTLSQDEKTLKLEVEVDDMIHVSLYVENFPYTGVSTFQSIGTKFPITDAMHNSIITLSKAGYTVQESPVIAD